MEFQIVQVSSLEKIRANDSLKRDEIHEKTVLAGERLSYQICMKANDRTDVGVVAESDLPGDVRLYLVRDAYIDVPAREEDMEGEDYVTLEPGFMPSHTADCHYLGQGRYTQRCPCGRLQHKSKNSARSHAVGPDSRGGRGSLYGLRDHGHSCDSCRIAAPEADLYQMVLCGLHCGTA